MITLSFPYFDISFNFVNYWVQKKKFLPGPSDTQADPVHNADNLMLSLLYYS